MGGVTPRKAANGPVAAVTELREFVRSIVAQDLEMNKYEDRVRTCFLPEPNGYLHIGHAKSICLGLEL